jgi:hypothetical protein
MDALESVEAALGWLERGDAPAADAMFPHVDGDLPLAAAALQRQVWTPHALEPTPLAQEPDGHPAAGGT